MQQVVEEEGRTMSEFLREAIRLYMEEREWLRRFPGQELGPGEHRLLPLVGFLAVAVAQYVHDRRSAASYPVAAVPWPFILPIMVRKWHS